VTVLYTVVFWVFTAGYSITMLERQYLNGKPFPRFQTTFYIVLAPILFVGHVGSVLYDLLQKFRG
jgi:hypothetical protein